MPSSYTDSSRLTKQGIGENDNTWGIIANTQYDLIDDAINGVLSLNVTTGLNLTLTANNGASDESRNKVIKLTGTPTANISIIVPAVHKEYLVDAQFTGNFTVTVTPTGGGAGVAFTAGQTGVIYCDGVNFTRIYQSAPMWNFGDLKMTMGTLVSALAANPGWAACDGNNGTPDLRKRFVIHADADTAGVATSSITGTALQTGGTTTTSSNGAVNKKTGSTVLTIAQIPSHFHESTGGTGAVNAGTAYYIKEPFEEAGFFGSRTTSTGGGEGHDHDIVIDAHTHTIVQPFYAVIFLMKL